MKPAAPALIGIAHGSRNPAAAEATESLVAAAGALLGVEAHAAYLEDFASPSIPEVVGALAEHGYSSAIAVPLLFTEAYHATEDAPGGLHEAEKAHDITLAQTGVIGTGEDLVTVLASHLARGESEGSRGEIILLGVGSSRPGANEAVESLARKLSARISRDVHARFATCAPRLGDRLEAGTTPGTVLPLFAAPGLLLDKARGRAEEAGWLVLGHLGDALAPIVAARYESALKEFSAREGSASPP